jgi:hypothetical protein
LRQRCGRKPDERQHPRSQATQRKRVVGFHGLPTSLLGYFHFPVPSTIVI